MARPDRATITAQTSSGVPFQWLMDGYSGRGARDANQEVMQALVSWSDSTDFLRDVVGYTEWDGTSPILNRVVPHQCPFNETLYCESYRIVDFGCYDTREITHDPFNENVFECDWCIYELVFTRPPYWVRGDDTLTNSYDGIEKNRYTSLQRRYRPREKRISSYGFTYDTSALGEGQPAADRAIVPDETAFSPDYTVEFLLKLHQWPVDAIPEQRWASQLLTVNHGMFQLQKGGFNFEKESLLFKGPAEPIAWYQGADGNFYFDTTLVFDYRPGKFGWNGYEKRDRDPAVGAPNAGRKYGRVYRRNVTTDTTPYALTPFDDLFKPGNS